jgi:hypothetical protein
MFKAALGSATTLRLALIRHSRGGVNESAQHVQLRALEAASVNVEATQALTSPISGPDNQKLMPWKVVLARMGHAVVTQGLVQK